MAAIFLGNCQGLAWLILVLCGVGGSFACQKSQNKDARTAKTTVTDPPPIADGSGSPASGTTPPQQSGGSDVEDFPKGSASVLTVGANLAELTFDNARTRCDYVAKGSGLYDILCRAVAIQPNGLEIGATSIAAGVELAWQAPVTLAGDVTSANCTTSVDSLSRRCEITLAGALDAAKLRFDLTVADKPRARERVESFIVTLPFSVGIVAGFVPQIPFSYVGAKTVPGLGLADAEPGTEPIALGFQARAVEADQAAFDGLRGVCTFGDRVFFTASRFIYRLEAGGKVSLYAGAASARAAKDQSHRLRYRIGGDGAYFMQGGLICTKDGVISSFGEPGEIVHFHDDGSVEKILGSGAEAYALDGTLAATAPYFFGGAIAFSPDGILHFVDGDENVIRKIVDGKIVTVAGSSVAGNDADGVPALEASIGRINTMAFAPNGDLVFFDSKRTAFRRVDAQGKIATIYTSTSEPIGFVYGMYFEANGDLIASMDGYPAPAGSPEFTLGAVSALVLRIAPDGKVTHLAGAPDLSIYDGDRLPALTTGLQAPRGVAPGEGGTIFVATFNHARLRRLEADGTLSTVAGSKPAFVPCKIEEAAEAVRLKSPLALRYDASGDILVLDLNLARQALRLRQNGRVERIGSCEGEIESTVLSGIFADVEIHASAGGDLAVGPDGAIYTGVGDFGITKIAADGTSELILDHRTSDEQQAIAEFIGGQADPNPMALAFDSAGRLHYTTKVFIVRIEPNGDETIIAGTGQGGSSGDGAPAIMAAVEPSRIAFGKDGTLYFTEMNHHRIRKIGTDGVVTTIAGTGIAGDAADGQNAATATLNIPTSLAVAPDEMLYFTESNRVRAFSAKPGSDAKLTTIFAPDRTDGDCGTGRIEGVAKAGEIEAAIRNTTAVLCAGVPLAVAVDDTCPGVGGRTRIAISQVLAPSFSNVIEIERPCVDAAP